MKNKLRWIVSILFVAIILFFACSKDSTDETIPQTKPETDTEVEASTLVPESTKVLTKDAGVTFDERNNAITIKNPDALDKSIEKGDILVSAEDGGYLLKVVSVKHDGKTVTANTIQATLEETFQNLDLTLEVPIEEESQEAQEQGVTEQVYYNAKPTDGSVTKFNVNSEDRLGTRSDDKKQMECIFKLPLDKDSLVLLEGKMKIFPILKGDIKIRKYKLIKANIGFEIVESLSLEYHVKEKISLADSIKLGSIAFKEIIVLAGGVPIVIQPEFEIYLCGKITVEGKIKLKAEQEYSYNVGVQYNGGVWDEYKYSSNAATLGFPTIEAETKSKVYLKPVFKLKFYKVVSPKIEIETGIKANAKTTSNSINGFNFDWSVDAYLEAYMGVDVAVLGKSLANYKTDNPILALNFNIVSAEDYKGNRPPDAPKLITPKNNLKTSGSVTKFDWSCTDFDSDPLMYDLYIGTKNENEYKWTIKHNNIKTPEFTLTKELDSGTYYWKVVAKEVKTETIKEPKQSESIVYSFTIIEPNELPSQPKLLTPENNVTINELTTLSWKASNDADGDNIKYNIYLTEPDGEDLAPIETDYTDTNYKFIEKRKEEGTYKWQVVATDGKANTESEIFNFTIKKASTFTLSTNKISLKAYEADTVTITSGSGNYTAMSNNDNIASVSIERDTITITGKSKGETFVTVTDIETKQTQEVAVTVNENPNAPEGVVIENGVLVKWPNDKIPANGHVDIPSSVTSIGAGAFSMCNRLNSIKITNSVKSIGRNAFNNTNLASVIIPNSITRIEGYTFSQCYNLTSVTLSNSLTYIGPFAFQYCNSLISITIPNSVTTIDFDAFMSCENLNSIFIPSSVKEIHYGAFVSCKNLKSIDVDINNKMYSSTDGVLFDKEQTTLIQYPAGKAKQEYQIPNSVTNIEESAFRDCANLTSVTLGNSVTSIGRNAFNSCKSLTLITLGNSVTSIGYFAFLSCPKLTSIDVDINNDIYSSINGVLFNNERTAIMKYPEGRAEQEYQIPNSVTSIERQAFHKCNNLTSIIIPKLVTGIGEQAFAYCSKLKFLKCKATTPPKIIRDAYSSDFSTHGYRGKLITPKGCKEAYQQAEGWKECNPIVEEGEE